MNAIVKFVKFLEKNLFRSFENGVAASQARVPALDTLMSSCPDLHTLKVTFFFKIFLFTKVHCLESFVSGVLLGVNKSEPRLICACPPWPCPLSLQR